MSGASERPNGLVSGPVLTFPFMAILNHSAMLACLPASAHMQAEGGRENGERNGRYVSALVLFSSVHVFDLMGIVFPMHVYVLAFFVSVLIYVLLCIRIEK